MDHLQSSVPEGQAHSDEPVETQERVQKKSFLWPELFDQAPEAAAVTRLDDRILRVNKEFTRMFGYEEEEVLERPIHDLIVPEALVASAREYTHQLKQGHRVEVETVRRRKDGRDVRISIVAVPVTATSGEQIANYAIYRDITEQKHAEERLRESEARFQEMADTAPVLIWMTGTDGLCNYFNKPWLEFTGRSMEQEAGTGWIGGVHPDDVQGCLDGFLPAFHARIPFRMEYRLRRADGEYRWVIESGIPRYTGAGEFAGYIGSNIDITDLKRAQEEQGRLRQLEGDLARINRVSIMGELAASLAHEVKQPIAAAIMDAKTCARWLRREARDCRARRGVALNSDVGRVEQIVFIREVPEERPRGHRRSRRIAGGGRCERHSSAIVTAAARRMAARLSPGFGRGRRVVDSVCSETLDDRVRVVHSSHRAFERSGLACPT